jgi:MFS family permease
MPLQLLAVGCVVGGLLAITVMTVRVVPASLRGTAFSLSAFIGSLGAAFSPLVIGAIADRFDIVVAGQVKGDLARAFLLITPMVTIGGLIVLRGRRHAHDDVHAVTTARRARGSRSAPGS